MDILQIVILGLGAVMFTVSFFIPDKQTNPKETREKEEKIFKELMQRELPDIRKKMDEEVQESIEQVKESTKRQMERLTNEKMMAINEYSDTVMTEIHKNHEEAVFLYDMLNNKHAQVKNTAAELAQVIRQSKQMQSAVKNTKVKEEKVSGETSSLKGSRKKAASSDAAGESAVQETFSDKAGKFTVENASLTTAVSGTENSDTEVSEAAVLAKAGGQNSADKSARTGARKSGKAAANTTAKDQADAPAAAFEPMETEKLEKIAFGKNLSKQEEAKEALSFAEERDNAEENPANNVEVLFATEGNEANSNDRILELHKAGKSNMAIARELGLGIGEVKLVIDLFKGGM